MTLFFLAVGAFNCNFESNLCGWTQLQGRDAFDWSRHRGSTSSSNTGPPRDHTTGRKLAIFWTNKENKLENIINMGKYIFIWKKVGDIFISSQVFSWYLINIYLEDFISLAFFPLMNYPFCFWVAKLKVIMTFTERNGFLKSHCYQKMTSCFWGQKIKSRSPIYIL